MRASKKWAPAELDRWVKFRGSERFGQTVSGSL
jgi:hypothetical protein